MKDLFSSRIAKAIVDILLVAGLLLSIFSARRSADSWASFHCIVSMAWYALMLLHIWQHWRLTKALVKWKVMKRNAVTSLTILVFVLMTLSVITFIADISDLSVRIHHIIAHVFWAVIIIHALTKTKRFISLFRRRAI
ncbi:MAG: hypothetical protein FWE10_07055 [Rikenellaceae bacterium]|nr:hypothetical protein [Rikenellaceae bacterium]MCL2693405.1 hypothetical protein [Rikenellaceae bacterium]